MSKSTQWSVKGIDEDTRKVAREAARASDLTIGKWIESAILQSTGLGARMRRLALATRRRTGSARPGVTVGATSREALAVPGEVQVAVRQRASCCVRSPRASEPPADHE